MNDNVISFPVKKGIVPSRLKDARVAACLNQSDLAAAVGITRQAISSYEHGEKTPELETLARIANVLQQPLSYFTSDDRPVPGPFSSLFLRAVGPNTKRRNMACGVISKWFAQVTTYFDSFVNFPAVSLVQAAPNATNGRYEAEEIELVAEECRKKWQLGLGPIADVVSLMEAHGIAVCRFGIEREDSVEAFSFWSGSRPFVVLSSEKESAARSRFDAAHELGHLILHRWVGSEELEDPKVLKIIEREADRFATAFLLPRASFPAEVFTSRLDAFVTLKRRWGVSIQAMIFRCKQLGIFDEDQVTNLYKQISARRWRTREPLDDVRELPLEQPKLLRRAIELVVAAGRKAREEIVAELQLAGRRISELCNLPLDYFATLPVREFSPSLR